MAITGKQINAALQIMKLVAEANGEPLGVQNILKYAPQVAALIAVRENDITAIEKNIVARMVTIKAEAE